MIAEDKREGKGRVGLGFVGFHILGGFIHILLVLAIILFLIRIIRGEDPLK